MRQVRVSQTLKENRKLALAQGPAAALVHGHKLQRERAHRVAGRRLAGLGVVEQPFQQVAQRRRRLRFALIPHPKDQLADLAHTHRAHRPFAQRGIHPVAQHLFDRGHILADLASHIGQPFLGELLDRHQPLGMTHIGGIAAENQTLPRERRHFAGLGQLRRRPVPQLEGAIMPGQAIAEDPTPAAATVHHELEASAVRDRDPLAPIGAEPLDLCRRQLHWTRPTTWPWVAQSMTA